MKKFLPSAYKIVAGLGLMAALGASAFATARPAPVTPDVPAARMVEDRIALREEHRAMRAERRAAREARRESRLEDQLAFMRDRLGITDTQAPLWDAFAENLRENMDERFEARSEPRDADLGRPSALERLAREQERLTARIARLDATASALAPLYDTLDDEQKQTADRMLRRLENGRWANGNGGPRNQRRGGMRHGMLKDVELEQVL